MSKQISRQNSKQNRSPNKQGTQQTSTSVRQPNQQVTRQAMKNERRREEQLRREEEKRRASRTKRITLISIITVVVLLVTTVGIFYYFNNAQSQSTETIVNSNYQPVEGIYCDQQEQLAYHIHVHLSIYVDGKQVPVSQGIGIAPDNSCIYWLHTHDSQGVIHIESPTAHTYTLGNFLDLWGTNFSKLGYPEPLDANVTTGWQVYVNGKPYTGNFRSIPLNVHTLITLAYNSPNAKPDTTFNWGNL